MLRGDLGYAAGSAASRCRSSRLTIAGGPDSVRGYRAFSLGPRDADGNAIGGNTQGHRRRRVPVPDAGRGPQDQSLRLAAFIDAGQVYAADARSSFGELRYAAGLGAALASPFGPLRLSFAQPAQRASPGTRYRGYNSPSAPASEA